MATGCTKDECTVADTGLCSLNNDPEKCEFRAAGGELGVVETEQEIGKGALDTEDDEPILDAPEAKPSLDNGQSLGIADLRRAMAEKPTLFIGIVGSPAAGKTAVLVSLYLLIAHNKLEGFQFADSRTLLSLDEISQGARRWESSAPDELTERTKLSDVRSAGFLHLQLLRESDQKLVDIALPDLPGEWSEALADMNRTDRLDFLRSADTLWLVINGAELRNPQTRMHTIRRATLMLQRLSKMLEGYPTQFKLIVSHADEGKIPEPTRTKLQKIANDYGRDAQILEIASFSQVTEVPAGAGIAELISGSFPDTVERPVFWEPGAGQGKRFISRFETGLRP